MPQAPRRQLGVTRGLRRVLLFAAFCRAALLIFRWFINYLGLWQSWGQGFEPPQLHQNLDHRREAGRSSPVPTCLVVFLGPSRGRTPRPDARRGSHFTGTRAGAPLALIRTTRNLAGFVVLTFRPTTWMSMGPS